MANFIHSVAVAFGFIGLMFVVLLAIGLAVNGKQCALAIDQFIGTCVIVGHMADETISAWAHREHHKRTERLINFVFRDPNHCASAYINEMERVQSPAEYRQ